MFFADCELRDREPDALRSVLELYFDLERVAANVRELDVRQLRDEQIRDLSTWLTRAVRSGAVVLEKEPPIRARARRHAEAPRRLPSLERPTPRREREHPSEVLRTWFEVQVLDEVGAAVDGLAMVLDAGGTQRSGVTDGSGVLRIDDFPSDTGSFASIRFASETCLRETMLSRWQEPRGREWITPEQECSLVQVRRTPLPSVSVPAERPHTVVLQPRVVRARLTGGWFETNKCFLLPPGRTTLSAIAPLYEQNRGCNLLVVGHTDAAGDPSYNDVLSLERAQSMVAFLTDDVAAWYVWYGESAPAAKRWGAAEDRLMIEALGCPEDTDPVSWYQETRGLKVDGLAGPQTRHALISEYMQLDGTSLPPDISATAHGCGENFPLVDGGEHEQFNRRVELLFFDGPILPPVPGANSGQGALEYVEWMIRTTESHQFDTTSPELPTALVPVSQVRVARLRYVSGHFDSQGAKVVRPNALEKIVSVDPRSGQKEHWPDILDAGSFHPMYPPDDWRTGQGDVNPHSLTHSDTIEVEVVAVVQPGVQALNLTGVYALPTGENAASPATPHLHLRSAATVPFVIDGSGTARATTKVRALAPLPAELNILYVNLQWLVSVGLPGDTAETRNAGQTSHKIFVTLSRPSGRMRATANLSYEERGDEQVIPVGRLEFVLRDMRGLSAGDEKAVVDAVYRRLDVVGVHYTPGMNWAFVGNATGLLTKPAILHNYLWLCNVGIALGECHAIAAAFVLACRTVGIVGPFEIGMMYPWPRVGAGTQRGRYEDQYSRNHGLVEADPDAGTSAPHGNELLRFVDSVGRDNAFEGVARYNHRVLYAIGEAILDVSKNPNDTEASHENASHYYQNLVLVDTRRVLKFVRAASNADPGVDCEQPYPSVNQVLFTWTESQE